MNEEAINPEAKYDLVALEGYEYRSKIFDMVVGDHVTFVTRTHLKGVLLKEPIVESEKDFELVELKKNNQ